MCVVCKIRTLFGRQLEGMYLDKLRTYPTESLILLTRYYRTVDEERRYYLCELVLAERSIFRNPDEDERDAAAWIEINLGKE